MTPAERDEIRRMAREDAARFPAPPPPPDAVAILHANGFERVRRAMAQLSPCDECGRPTTGDRCSECEHRPEAA